MTPAPQGYQPPRSREFFLLVREASDPALSLERFCELAQRPEHAILASLLCNSSPHIPDEELHAIATRALDMLPIIQAHEDERESLWVLLQGVAASTRLQATHYHHVALAEYFYVWICLANNPSCPENLLLKLAQDPTSDRNESWKKEIRKIARDKLARRGMTWSPQEDCEAL